VKRIFAILLAFLVALPLMLKVCAYTSWKINQNYIAKTSCENRNNPASNCAGSCQLIKQLKTIDNQKKPYTPTVRVEKIELSSYTTITTTKIVATDCCHTAIYFNLHEKLIKPEIVFSFFHPPQPLV